MTDWIDLAGVDLSSADATAASVRLLLARYGTLFTILSTAASVVGYLASGWKAARWAGGVLKWAGVAGACCGALALLARPFRHPPLVRAILRELKGECAYSDGCVAAENVFVSLGSLARGLGRDFRVDLHDRDCTPALTPSQRAAVYAAAERVRARHEAEEDRQRRAEVRRKREAWERHLAAGTLPGEVPQAQPVDEVPVVGANPGTWAGWEHKPKTQC